VPPAPASSLRLSRLPDFVESLDARVDALAPVEQLDLAEQLAGCAATLDWQRCRLASSFALRECGSPNVATSASRRGGIVMQRLGGIGTPEVPESAITELALAFSQSEYAARDLIAVGLDLRYRLPYTAAELGGGRIGYQHAKVISEATRELSVDAVEALDARLSDAAATRTPPRLRVLARRLVACADAEGMQRRHRDAYADRNADAFAVGDGMGAFSLTHQLEVAVAADEHLTAWARRRRLLDPTTGLAAHKADAAAHLLLGQHPVTGESLLTGTQAGKPSRSAVSGGDTEEEMDELAPGQHTPPWPMPGSDLESAFGDDPEVTVISPWPDVATLADPAAFLPAHADIKVLMRADTLLGIDDEACEIEGFGPITAEQARRLAVQAASSTLQRAFTDPADDSVLFLDARRYRFSRRQQDHIRTVHQISTFPGATTRATRCDIDHGVPYRHGRGRDPDPPGQTVADNGQPLARRQHRLRTHAGWEPHLDPDRPHVTLWTSPHGRHYLVDDHDGA